MSMWSVCVCIYIYMQTDTRGVFDLLCSDQMHQIKRERPVQILKNHTLGSFWSV